MDKAITKREQETKENQVGSQPIKEQVPSSAE